MTANPRKPVRSSGPVVPARREQRIERSPQVRRAGEVRGRTRPTGRGDAWAAVPDLAVPVGPATAEFAVDAVPAVDDLPVPDVDGHDALDALEMRRALDHVGQITYDRVVLPPRPLETMPVEEVAASAVADPVAAPAAPAAPPRPRRSLFRRRTRVRRVSRIVRRVDAWSVLKISVIFYALAYVVVLVAGVLLWNLAQTTGTVANVEGFIRELFGLREFTIDGARLYRASWPIGVFLAVAGTGLNVTAAVMFNLITDLVGGVRVTVLEEEVRVIETPMRRRLGRRARTASATVGAAGRPPQAG